MSGLFNLALAVGAVVVPFILGVGIARRLRMPDYGWKIGLVLFSLIAPVVILASGGAPKLGIDLSGGVILVYNVQAKSDQPINWDELISSLSLRVNPGGVREITLRRFGESEIEIIVPKVDEEEARRIERRISSIGLLEFRILANNRDHESIIEQARALPLSVRKLYSSKDKVNPIAVWVPVREGRLNDFPYPEIATRMGEANGKKVPEILVVTDPFNVTGGFLEQARAGHDETGNPAVQFSFNTEGGARFGELTGANTPEQGKSFTRKLGIILDDYLYSAPAINSRITTQGIIQGRFTQQEVQDIVNVLNAGQLPATLSREPVSKLVIGATLGQDTIQASTRAMLVAAILIPLFMIWYYRFSGVLAVLALTINMLALVALMISIQAAFTLSGLAGLALTVGMAVDNNVLVYERLREERERGATLRMAIRNAFQKATATIVDANVTTLITAAVLYYIGTDQVKGFAVALFLGVSLSMFTSIFVSRVLFDIAEKRRWITEARMLKLFGHTNFDFMRFFPVAATISILAVVVGLIGVVARGQGILDIDFTGGVTVQMQLKQSMEPAAVRKAIENAPPEYRFDSVLVNSLQPTDQLPDSAYLISTNLQDLLEVERRLEHIFGDRLQTNKMQWKLVTGAGAAAETTGTAPGNSAAAPQSLAAPMSGTAPANAGTTLPASKETAPAGADLPSPNENTEGSAPKADAKPSESTSRWGHSGEAYAAEIGTLFAQAEGASAPAGAPAATATATATNKTVPTETSPPAAATAAATSTATTAAPAETPTTAPVASATASPVPTATGTTGPARPTATTATAPVDPFAKGTTAAITLAFPLGHESVESLVAEELGPQRADVQRDVTNPLFAAGDTSSHTNWTVRIALPPAEAEPLLREMQAKVAATAYFPASSVIGPAVAGNTQLKAYWALVLSWLAIMIYLWIRFQRVAYGLAAVVSLIHDVLVMIAGVALSHYLAMIPGVSKFLLIESFKIDLPMVAAFLTIIGYSVNDTIVVFDRIRENRGKLPYVTRAIVNNSINETLSRTVITAFTVFLVCVILYIFGGTALRGFNFALMIGVLSGCLSSIYVASPILLFLTPGSSARPTDSKLAPSK